MSIVAVAGLACGATQRVCPTDRRVSERPVASRPRAASSGPMRIVPAFVLKDPCRNWKEALQKAKRISGCGANGVRESCPKCAIPCNTCQFLEDGFFPVARVVQHINLSIQPIAAVRPSEDGVREAVFRDWVCQDPHAVDTLAQAMVHESIHLCKEVVPATPATVDGPLRGVLGANPWPLPPDTEDLVSECWRNDDH